MTQEHRGRYRDLADKATDGSVVFPGEDLSTTFAEDADHWVRVYSELLAFKDGLIAKAEHLSGELESPAKQEVDATDLVLLQAERRRFRDRLDKWERRRDDLRSEA